MSEDIKETESRQHLRVVTEIADILDKEYPRDSDAMFFVIRTLRNIFLWESEDSHIEWAVSMGISKYEKRKAEKERGE